ncbi:DUF992 domain-containing protein [Salaquimonas pukyongi]|uniref:DUF992 domain-containing protein n=1 Tax=Salaquimonas pukyongi TaxID=2712698 RepID=UPI00096B910A|nr:DUF992 domain-containing protein [Salaquimonas pukyongi]
MNRLLTISSAMLALALSAFPISVSPAHAEAMKLGALECFVDAGGSYVVGSTKDVSCVLYGEDDEALEHYVGELKKYGVDIGFTEESLMVWDVFVANGKTYEPGALAGNYAGASANASVTFGLGASVLVGGLSENFALQPVQVAKQQGINIAIGITRMQLQQVAVAPEDSENDPQSVE